MFNKNAFRTSLLFIGIIFATLVTRMFANENALFIQSDDDASPQVAGINCVQEGNC